MVVSTSTGKASRSALICASSNGEPGSKDATIKTELRLSIPGAESGPRIDNIHADTASARRICLVSIISFPS